MKPRSLVYVVVCASFLALGALALASPPAGSYHLLKKIPLGAAPGGGEYFDYITFDAPTRRVYLSHGTEIKVMDADSYEVVGTISGLKRSHGVAIVRDLNKGFITDGDAEKVLVFDLKTFKITGEIKSYPDTDSIVYDPASKLIFTFNGDSKNSTVIDPAKDAVVKAIDLGGAVEFPVADGKGMVYDNNEEKNDIAAIDTKTLTVKARYPVAPAGTPVAMAMDRQHRRLFSSGRGPQMLVIMDADNGKVVQSFPISAGVDANVFEPETGMLFVSTREGKIHIYHEDTPDKFSEVETVNTEYGAKTMAVDPKTHNLFLTTADFGQPPAPTKERPNPQRPATPETFRLLVYGK
jgi:DNA-binding beta-propeller fold protein YncE